LSLLAHDLIRKPVPTFRDHALPVRDRRRKAPPVVDPVPHQSAAIWL